MRTTCPLVVLLALAGCSSGPSAEQACSKEGSDRCAALMMCSPADLSRRFGDLATCEARETLACVDGVDAPKTGQTPQNEENCGEQLLAQSCDAYLSNVMPPTACEPPDGPGSNGAPCAFSGQCSSGFCAVPSYGLCGTCALAPAAGASCASAGCPLTMTCVASTMLCEVPVPDGGLCSAGLPCASGLACVGSSTTTMGACTVQPTTVGASCDASRKLGPDCSGDAGLVCDSTTNTCVTEPLVAASQPCGTMNGVFTGCTGGATCMRPSGGATGTCVAPAADGAACDTLNGPTCLTPARCVTGGSGSTAGTCQLPGSMTCGV